MAEENFADVEWNQQHGSEAAGSTHDERNNYSQASNKNSSPEAVKNTPSNSSNDTPQAGKNADSMDLAGVGNATITCTVSNPIKENDGTKDAFVSYKITTHVCTHLQTLFNILILLDQLSHFL